MVFSLLLTTRGTRTPNLQRLCDHLLKKGGSSIANSAALSKNAKNGSRKRILRCINACGLLVCPFPYSSLPTPPLCPFNLPSLTLSNFNWSARRPRSSNLNPLPRSPQTGRKRRPQKSSQSRSRRGKGSSNNRFLKGDHKACRAQQEEIRDRRLWSRSLRFGYKEDG
jgi:hypothetical protein